MWIELVVYINSHMTHSIITKQKKFFWLIFLLYGSKCCWSAYWMVMSWHQWYCSKMCVLPNNMRLLCSGLKLSTPVYSMERIILPVSSDRHQRKHPNWALPVFCEGKPPVTVDSPHKRSVMWKAFSCHDVSWLVQFHFTEPWMIQRSVKRWVQYHRSFV